MASGGWTVLYCHVNVLHDCKAYVTKDYILWIFMIKVHILLYKLLLCSVL